VLNFKKEKKRKLIGQKITFNIGLTIFQFCSFYKNTVMPLIEVSGLFGLGFSPKLLIANNSCVNVTLLVPKKMQGNSKMGFTIFKLRTFAF
jgi:hypothetical protein